LGRQTRRNVLGAFDLLFKTGSVIDLFGGRFAANCLGPGFIGGAFSAFHIRAHSATGTKPHAATTTGKISVTQTNRPFDRGTRFAKCLQRSTIKALKIRHYLAAAVARPSRA